VAAIFVALGTLALACNDDGSGTGSSTPGGRVAVVASFYPIYEAAQQVGGDDATVSNLTPAGAEPHDLELSSRQVDRIEGAALVFYLGGGFQPGVEKAVQRAKGRIVDLLPADAAPEEDDPHFSLDPTLLMKAVERVKVAYREVDPAHAPGYEERAGAYLRELGQLESAFRQGLRNCDRRVIVTSHAAFGYLARQYGLTQKAVAGLSPESEPEPGELSALARQVKAEGVTTIFSEPLASPKVAQTLAREAGVGTAVLNPVEGLTKEEADEGKTYVSIDRKSVV
jgi:zinc transport system substrate-binding protein